MTDLDPTVLREWAGHLRVWPYWAVPYRAAAALDLLADLLDAIDTMRGRLPHPTNMTAFAKGRLSALDDLTAVLEAHRD